MNAPGEGPPLRSGCMPASGRYFPMLNILLVALGGAIGSVLRYLTSGAMERAFGDKFPFGTLAVNVIGCAAIGFLIPFWSGTHSAPHPMRLLVVTGILGGFTTFSAFGLETHRLFTRGETTLALLNIAVSVIVGLAAVGVGAKIGRAFG